MAYKKITNLPTVQYNNELIDNCFLVFGNGTPDLRRVKLKDVFDEIKKMSEESGAEVILQTDPDGFERLLITKIK